MSDYTPNTEDIRAKFVQAHPVRDWDAAYDAFNRWLFEHDRKNAEYVWDESRSSIAEDVHHERMWRPNPYRSTE